MWKKIILLSLATLLSAMTKEEVNQKRLQLMDLARKVRMVRNNSNVNLLGSRAERAFKICKEEHISGLVFDKTGIIIDEFFQQYLKFQKEENRLESIKQTQKCEYTMENLDNCFDFIGNILLQNQEDYAKVEFLESIEKCKLNLEFLLATDRNFMQSREIKASLIAIEEVIFELTLKQPSNQARALIMYKIDEFQRFIERLSSEIDYFNKVQINTIESEVQKELLVNLKEKIDIFEENLQSTTQVEIVFEILNNVEVIVRKSFADCSANELKILQECPKDLNNLLEKLVRQEKELKEQISEIKSEFAAILKSKKHE